jgi:hypothetical protein
VKYRISCRPDAIVTGSQRILDERGEHHVVIENGQMAGVRVRLG